MSTQPLAETTIVPPLIDDKPPAGTPCVKCKARGHWCPAAQYVGETDDGICKHCAGGTDCPVAQRLKKKEFDVFTVPADSFPAPVKHVPIPVAAETTQPVPVIQQITSVVDKAMAATQPKPAKPPVVPVPSYMCKTRSYEQRKTGRHGNPYDLGEAKKMRAEGQGLKQIAAKLKVGVARLRRELGDAAVNRKRTMRDKRSGPTWEERHAAIGLGSPVVMREANIVHPDEAKALRAQPAPLIGVLGTSDTPKEELSTPIYAPLNSYDLVIADLEEQAADLQRQASEIIGIVEALKKRRGAK